MFTLTSVVGCASVNMLLVSQARPNQPLKQSAEGLVGSGLRDYSTLYLLAAGITTLTRGYIISSRYTCCIVPHANHLESALYSHCFCDSNDSGKASSV